MYSERASSLPHVVAWWSVTPPGAREKRILPDGCLDIIWQDGRVFVAGPDTTAQLGAPPPGSRFFALRFGAGTGPGVLGLPASELVDRQWPSIIWESCICGHRSLVMLRTIWRKRYGWNPITKLPGGI